MTAERVALVGTVFAVAVLTAFWVAYDERLGRPQSSRSESAATDKKPIVGTSQADKLTARFALCDGPIRRTCVVDGDTFWFKGDKIRIADIDAPEISAPRCEDERIAGVIARDRLLELLNAGGFSLESGWRDTDRYGRKLRTVTRASRSLGEILVEEGLARRWGEPRRNWCSN